MKNKFWFYSIIILTKKTQRKVIPTFTLFFSQFRQAFYSSTKEEQKSKKQLSLDMLYKALISMNEQPKYRKDLQNHLKFT